ncbi:MAG TPA: T9SS type A sorting domain-containing protein [Phaeodactylibacter sp.]|nr:T9SS type A sorting domain-containing protein [Phaeodactylibacter sp.]
MLLLFLGGGLQAQKDQWLLYPTEVDFPAGPSFSAGPVTGGSTPYICENSVFDENGNLLFYLQYDDPSGYIEIYDGSGSAYGGIGTGDLMMKEIGIAPVPGACKSYCVFALRTVFLTGLELRYFEIEVDDNGQIVNTSSFVPVLDNQNNNQSIYSGNTGGLAVSKIIEGTEADRYIYVIPYAERKIFKYRMTADSVYKVQEYQLPSRLPWGLGSEVELSPCGDQIAWSIYANVYVYDFTSGALYEKANEGMITGLEFSDCANLFFAQENAGILRWDFAGTNSLAFVAGSSNYNETHLEKTVDDGRIYAVEQRAPGVGFLGKFDPTLLQVEQLSQLVQVTSDGVTATMDAFALPDQIDGEGDGSFFGVPPLVINEWGVNDILPPSSIEGEIPCFYDCNPLDLLVDYSGTAGASVVNIVSVDPATGNPLFGAPYLDFSGSVDLSNSPVDLRCLQDAVGCDLFEGYYGQTFRITIALENLCGGEEVVGYFKVLGPPTDVTDINLQIAPGNTTAFCPASQDLSSPCNAGTASGSIDFTNTNGDVTFYRIKIWDVDCATGEESLLYDGPQVAVNGSGNLAPIGLSSLEINGTTVYFVLNNYVGRCIRVEVEVGNPCGSITDFTYIQFDGNYFNGGDPRSTALLNGDNGTSASLYPNPFHGELNLQFEARQPQTAQFQLFSSTGQLVHQQVLSVDAGVNLRRVQLRDIPDGVYFYKLTTTDEVYSGSIVKQ